MTELIQNQYVGLVLSFGYVFFLMGVASLLLKFKLVSGNIARKVIHISVGHWWLLAMVWFESLGIALIGPIAFILINYAVARFHILPAMEAKQNNWGTVYYPISLLILVIASWGGFIQPWIGGVGILVLAWGDGMASIIGEAYGEKTMIFQIYGNRKSLLGFLSMVGSSFLVILIMLSIYSGLPRTWMLILSSLALALVAGLVELFTPYGLDNITVPLVTSVLVHWMVVQPLWG